MIFLNIGVYWGFFGKKHFPDSAPIFFINANVKKGGFVLTNQKKQKHHNMIFFGGIEGLGALWENSIWGFARF